LNAINADGNARDDDDVVVVDLSFGRRARLAAVDVAVVASIGVGGALCCSSCDMLRRNASTCYKRLLHENLLDLVFHKHTLTIIITLSQTKKKKINYFYSIYKNLLLQYILALLFLSKTIENRQK
jgi:hypothetical protein